MSGYGTTFDDFEMEGELANNDLAPIWSIKHNDEEKLLDWLKKDMENKTALADPRIRIYRENVALYKGIHYRSQETRTQDFRRDSGDRSIRNPKVVVNHVYDMVETKTAKMSRFRPSIAVLPANDEWHDKQNSRTVKTLVDSRWYEVDMDSILRDLQRGAYVYGECLVNVCWNPDAGILHPAQEKLDKEGVDIPLLDENKKTIKNEDGENVTIRSKVHVGDVDYEILYPDRYFPDQAAIVWDEVKHLTIVEYRHIEEVKADYPDKAKKIKRSSETRFDYEQFEERRLKADVPVKTFWHKPTKYLPKGMYVVYTDDVILEKTDFPYTHGQLPFVRLTDIDVPSALSGRSFISVIRQLQRHYNNLASGVARNHGLASAPKWVMPKGACSIKALNNEATIVEYQGPVPPRLENMNPTHAEIFNYMEKLEQNIQKLSAVHGISRGTPPSGIRAGVALQFLDEQEAERENNGVAKRNNAIRQIAKHTIALMSQFYKPDDGRMIRILGKDNQVKLESFDVADFTKIYDVRIQNSSSLPDSKPAKIQTIIDLSQAFPGMFQQEQVVDMLDLGSDKAFVDKATIAVKTAEYENEQLLSGKDVDEPQAYEDLFLHWDIHVKALQEAQYKNNAPLEVKAKFEEHIATTEMLMWERAGKNAMFRQKLLMLEAFPLFFTLDESSAIVMASGGAPMQPTPLESTLEGPVATNPTGEQPLPEALPQAEPVQGRE